MPATDITSSTLNTTTCGSFVKHVHFAVKMPEGRATSRGWQDVREQKCKTVSGTA